LSADESNSPNKSWTLYQNDFIILVSAVKPRQLKQRAIYALAVTISRQTSRPTSVRSGPNMRQIWLPTRSRVWLPSCHRNRS